MVSASVCTRGPAEPSSGGVAGNSGTVSPRSGRPFDSLHSGLDIRGVRRSGSRRRVGGVTVWVSSDRPAVRRNRAKRRIREALCRVPLDGRDYVVVATASVVTAPFEAVTEWIETAVRDREERGG